jgi:hypothetical protein
MGEEIHENNPRNVVSEIECYLMHKKIFSQNINWWVLEDTEEFQYHLGVLSDLQNSENVLFLISCLIIPAAAHNFYIL